MLLCIQKKAWSLGVFGKQHWIGGRGFLPAKASFWKWFCYVGKWTWWGKLFQVVLSGIVASSCGYSSVITTTCARHGERLGSLMPSLSNLFTSPLMKAELIFFTVSPRLTSNFMAIRGRVYKQFRGIYFQCTKPIDRQGWFGATIMEDDAWMLRLEINSQDEVSAKFTQNRQLETLVLRTDKTLAITTVIEPWLVFL